MGQEDKSVIPTDVKRGDLVIAYWLDITSDSTGNTKEAEVAKSITAGFYWGIKTSCKQSCLVLYETHCPGWSEGEENGSHIFPLSVITKLEVVRKKKDLKFNGKYSSKNR